jgi:hypothetical protein
MKTKILTIAGLLFLQLAVSAQEQPADNSKTSTSSRDARRKVVPGLKVGVNRSNVYDAKGNAFAAERKQGIAAGAFIALPINRFFGIQPELMFQQKGFEGSSQIAGETYVISRTTTHLDIPVQFQLKLFKWFSFLIGPQYSLLLNHTDNYSNSGLAAGRTTSDFNNDAPKKATFGTLMGIDLNFGHIVLSGRSGWDVTNNTSNGVSAAPNYKNRWVQGTVGYRFY